MRDALRFGTTLSIAALVGLAACGCGGAKPAAGAEAARSPRVRIDLPGVPTFHAPATAMEGRFGEIVEAVREALAVETPAAPPPPDAPEDARRSWLAREYLPYVQAHTAAYGRVVRRLGTPEDLAVPQQVTVMALLGWMKERAGRVTARIRAPEAYGVEPEGDPFEGARSHYEACAALAAEEQALLAERGSGESSAAARTPELEPADPARLRRWERFCRHRLQALAIPKDGARPSGRPEGKSCRARVAEAHRGAEALAHGRLGASPLHVRLPVVPADAAGTGGERAWGRGLSDAALRIAIGSSWVAFRGFRARSDAEAAVSLMATRLQERAARHRRFRRGEELAMLVFVDRDAPLERVGPLLGAARRAGPVYVAVSRQPDPDLRGRSAIEGAPDWYATWLDRWVGATDARGRRRILREAWARLFAGCDEGERALRALPTAKDETRWRLLKSVFASKAPSECICEAAASSALQPLLSLSAWVLLGPVAEPWRLEIADDAEPPVAREATTAEWVTAAGRAQPPRIELPTDWTDPPETDDDQR
ncbi:MAG: hypothetical protein ACOC97_02355 [Myxococcota bacterium]